MKHFYEETTERGYRGRLSQKETEKNRLRTAELVSDRCRGSTHVNNKPVDAICPVLDSLSLSLPLLPSLISGSQVDPGKFEIGMGPNNIVGFSY